jgi:hypothetical protein
MRELTFIIVQDKEISYQLSIYDYSVFIQRMLNNKVVDGITRRLYNNQIEWFDLDDIDIEYYPNREEIQKIVDKVMKMKAFL